MQKALTPPIAEAAQTPIQVVSIDDLIQETADKYHLNESHLHAVIGCESQFNVSAEGDGHTSIGIAQLHYPSAYWGISTSSAKDPAIAIDVMGKAWSDGEASKWSCYSILKNRNWH